jgi:hypothetical protein
MQLNNNITNEDGSLNQTGRILDILDFFFTLIFAFELSLNIFAHWFRTFINDGWNWFASQLDSHWHTPHFLSALQPTAIVCTEIEFHHCCIQSAAPS